MDPETKPYLQLLFSCELNVIHVQEDQTVVEDFAMKRFLAPPPPFAHVCAKLQKVVSWDLGYRTFL